MSDIDRAKIEDLFSWQEVKAIDALCKEQELTEVQVLRQALRLYQLVQVGLKQGKFTSQELNNYLTADKLDIKFYVPGANLMSDANSDALAAEMVKMNLAEIAKRNANGS